MKSKSLIALATAFCLAIPISAQALTNASWVLTSGTEIRGNLTRQSTNTFNGSTSNVSQNGWGTYAQTYAKYTGQVIGGSVDTRQSWGNYVVATSTVIGAEWLGSSHSSLASQDAYGSLYLYVGN